MVGMARPKAVEVAPKQADLTEAIAVSLYRKGPNAWVCRRHLLLGDQVIESEETTPDILSSALAQAMRTLSAEVNR